MAAKVARAVRLSSGDVGRVEALAGRAGVSQQVVLETAVVALLDLAESGSCSYPDAFDAPGVFLEGESSRRAVAEAAAGGQVRPASSLVPGGVAGSLAARQARLNGQIDRALKS